MITITVPDGYNGHTVELDASHVVRIDHDCAALHVASNHALMLYVRLADYPWLADLPTRGPDPRESLLPR